MRRSLVLLLACSGVVGSAPRSYAEPPESDLVAAARSSERPEECAGRDHAGASLWDRARVPGLDRYCDALVLGYAALGTHPESALAAASRADVALPGRAGPRLLRARAELRLGQASEAFGDFEGARKLSAASVEALGALRDFAFAAGRTGHADEALSLYRELVSRAGFLEDGRQGVQVLVEAASLAMSAGPSHLSEAVGYLSEARRGLAFPELRDVVLGLLALAFDRQGKDGEADGVSADASGPWSLEAERERLLAHKPTSLPELAPGDLDALIAELAETRDSDLAAERWKSYLEGPGKAGPYLKEARAAANAVAKRRKRAK